MSAVTTLTPKRAFSLIELILVVVLIGIASMLVISNPPKTGESILQTEKLRDVLYPKGTLYIFRDGGVLLEKEDENKTGLNVNINFPKVYVYENGDFMQKNFAEYDNKSVVFKYGVNNGIGDSFILYSNGFYYVFKPFKIIKTDDFEKAKDIYLGKNFFPSEGEIY